MHLRPLPASSTSPNPHREPEKVAVEEQPVAPPVVEAAGYSKLGPGPMAAIRFKWTVREDHGDYYVDETIGENSTPLVTRADDKGRRDQVRG